MCRRAGIRGSIGDNMAVPAGQRGYGTARRVKAVKTAEAAVA